jgi:hypothetical protein
MKIKFNSAREEGGQAGGIAANISGRNLRANADNRNRKLWLPMVDRLYIAELFEDPYTTAFPYDENAINYEHRNSNRGLKIEQG